MRELCLSVRNLSFYYAEGEGTAKAALNDVSFEVKKGEYLAVLGANGSGKSTLLNCINGLLTPKAGAVTVYDRDGLARDPALAGDLNAIRRSAGSVMQNPDNQIVASVVEEDAAFGPSNLGLDEAEIRRRVDNALALTGLLGKREKPPEFLSGGEKQRLALAGALAMDCDCLILDEAASMLDPAAREKLYDILDALIEQGKTILLVTHSFEEAFRCNRALVLSDGGLVFDGKPPELLAHADLEAWGFRLSESARTLKLLMDRYPEFSAHSLDPEKAADEIAAFIRSRVEYPRARLSAGEKDPFAGVQSRVRDLRGGPDAAGREKSPASPLIDFADVSHEYQKGTIFASTGIRGVNFSVDADQSFCLIGTSGSGKTTALKHINALLLPSRGRVLVDGEDTLDVKTRLRRLRFKAALAIQNPESALFERYVADDAAYGPRAAGVRGPALRARVEAALEACGLPYADYGDREVAALSGGEKRRAALAGVAALDSKILLLDEPTAALDGRNRERIMAMIADCRRREKTVVATTHSMENAAAFDVIGVMSGGRLVAAGPPREIFGGRWDPAWGLRLPWTAAAARRLAAAGLTDSAAVPLNAEEFVALLTDAAAELSEADADIKRMRFTAGSDDVKRDHIIAAGDDIKRDRIIAAGDDVKRMRITAAGGDIKRDRFTAESRANSAVTTPRRRRRGGGESFHAISLGQFLDRPSPLRSLGAAVKLPLLFAAGLIAIAGPHQLFPLGVLVFVLAAGRAAGRVGPFILLGGLRSAAPYLVFIIFIQTAFTWNGDTSAILFKLGFYSITKGEISRSLSLALRLLALMSSLTLYMAVTPLRETLRALTRFLKPLARVGIPGGDIAMTIAIALRFVPVLTEEARRIAAAQLSRGGGADAPGPARLRAATGMLLPLFLRALERSERLADAMTLRCYQGGAGNKYAE